MGNVKQLFSVILSCTIFAKTISSLYRTMLFILLVVNAYSVLLSLFLKEHVNLAVAW